MKLFSTRTHGALDYSSVVLLLALPRALGWSRPVTNLLTGSALATLFYSAGTRYELGLVRRLPMAAHVRLDRASGLTLAAAAALMAGEPGKVRASLLALGLFEVAASLATETLPQGEA